MNPNTYHDLWLPRSYLEEGEHDPGDFDNQGGTYFRSHRLYGGGHAAMFGGKGLTTRPFATAPAHIPDKDRDLIKDHVAAAIKGHIHTENIDPRWLHMTQSAVTSVGVRYYLEDPTYRESGITFADQHQAGNRFPVILQHPRLGMRLILSGHHRASAALASGQALKALVVRQGG